MEAFIYFDIILEILQIDQLNKPSINKCMNINEIHERINLSF